MMVVYVNYFRCENRLVKIGEKRSYNNYSANSNLFPFSLAFLP